MNPHLWVTLSGHGFGHLAQTAPILNRLREDLPGLRLTLQSALPATVLRQRIMGTFEHVPESVDVGMLMADALDVQIPQSLAAYRQFHAEWARRLARQEALLDRFRPDLLLANVPYLPLAAAANVAIPAVALCSLHWADIVPAYFPATPELADWRWRMLESYQQAAVFLRPAPSMPMPDLSNTRAIGPIALRGRRRRAEINQRLGLSGDETVVLVALGGIDNPLPVADWSILPGVRWLAPGTGHSERGNALDWSRVADLPFIELLESCDVILTKPGYGSFTEAACAGKPVLYVERNDWPEQSYLVDWLSEYGRCLCIEREALKTGDLAGPLDTLLNQPSKPPPRLTGLDAAVECLLAYLSGRSATSR